MTLIVRLQEAIQEFEQSASKLSTLMEKLDPAGSHAKIGDKCKYAKHLVEILIAGEKLTGTDPKVQA